MQFRLLGPLSATADDGRGVDVDVLVPAPLPVAPPEPAPMPTMPPPAGRASDGMLFDVARPDAAGRITARPLLRALGWIPGLPYDVEKLPGGRVELRPQAPPPRKISRWQSILP
ncbi:hypothetical protein [Micromonospora sp. RTP1Z1]|uniref:hypothetical protein n=1 Tax=Micromonospora sp. RTP1Z1 TaxID=2994043 RepID=UPI0029C74964|nr:hypothetical protein [Micromonospora sp. RTP1Z1]